MTLRKKTLLIIGATLVSLIAILYLTSSILLMRSFAKLEEQNVHRNVERVLTALSYRLAELNAMAGDWAEWDDTYAFIAAPHNGYIQSNLVDSTFTNFKLNLLLFIHTSGRVVFGQAFDLEKEKKIPVPRSLQSHLSANSPLLRHPSIRSRLTGIVLLPEGPLLVVSRPILTSAAQGPSRGTLIMGRYLDAAEIKHLSEIVRLSLTVHRFDDPQRPPDFQTARASLSKESPIFIRPLSERSIAGYALLMDLYGKPGLLVRTDLPRAVYLQGRASVRYFLWSLLTLGLIFGGVTLWLLEKSVLSRLARLSTEVHRIGERGNLSARVAMAGKDELSSLAGHVNGMLGSLEQAQRDLRAIVETVPEGMLLLDAERWVRLSNPTASEYLLALGGAEAGERLTHLGGRPLEELLGPPPEGSLSHEVWSAEASASAREVWSAEASASAREVWSAEASASAREVWSAEASASARQQRLTHSKVGMEEPRRRVFEVEARPLEAGAENGGWVMVLREVTKEREIQRRLAGRERLAAVGQLAAGIAHDFNNILQSILGFSELLLIRSDLPAKTREPLETICQQGQQAAQLIQQILDFSRKSVSQKFPVDLGPMLKEAMKLLERTLPESLTLELEIAPGEHRVHADLAQIQQVLTNLVFNARDAMPEGGTLRIHLGRWTLEPEGRAPFPSMEPGEWVVLKVSDTGTGIAPEVLPHLFEPFFTTKQLGRGTGLGLAQVYGIVKQHEGFIDVETEVGRGTTFLVYLPAVLEDGEEPEEQPAGEAPQGQGQTILLVENEEKVLEAAQRILESLGYRVRTARNGQEALQEYERHQEEIALLITDMVMPEMGGLPLVQALRERGSQVRVVVLSGYPLEDGGDHIWGDEAIAWAAKPLSRKQFGEVVGRMLAARPPRG